tara:strand:+ start:113 stop:718 length:606 start_codon:yes stop_codon:yes gene_type:complete
MADFKRQTAYKLKIGDVFKGKKVLDGERFTFLELGDKNITRINIVANVVEKYSSNEKAYVSLTIDDASGQIRVKIFGEDVARFIDVNQGDTVMVVGLLRNYNDELYITPELIKKQDPRYLLVRKLEFESLEVKIPDNKEVVALADKLISKIKDSEPEGIGKDKIIEDFKDDDVSLINQEIGKALEQGIIYEPRPGMLRFLG